MAHYINSRLCLHGGLSGLAAGGRKGIQLMWQEREREGAREREKERGEKKRKR